MSSKESTAKREQIKSDLLQGDEKEAAAALDFISEGGDGGYIATLLEAYSLRREEILKLRIGEMLSTLKVSGSEPMFVAALNNSAYSDFYTDILGFMWNSGVNVPGELPLLIRVGLSGDYMRALEAFTLIESMEGPFDEEQVLEAILAVRKFLEAEPEGDKRDLVNSLLEYLDQTDRES
jgi:hypothetical protein